MRPSTSTTALLAALVTATLLLAPHALPDASATHRPADKVSVAGATLEILTEPLLGAGSDTATATLLQGTLRTSTPTDLVLTVTLECALWTEVVTVGNDESEAAASVKVWIEIDGEPVRIAGDAVDDDGKVVFCNRAHRARVADLDDENARFEHFLRTRTANAFQWVSLNVGNGLHTIAVKAELDTTVEGAGMSQAGIGKRTLVVEPTKLANDVTL